MITNIKKYLQPIPENKVISAIEYQQLFLMGMNLSAYCSRIKLMHECILHPLSIQSVQAKYKTGFSLAIAHESENVMNNSVFASSIIHSPLLHVYSTKDRHVNVLKPIQGMKVYKKKKDKIG